MKQILHCAESFKAVLSPDHLHRKSALESIEHVITPDTAEWSAVQYTVTTITANKCNNTINTQAGTISLL